jgi:large-conductance mechanosensitive channel
MTGQSVFLFLDKYINLSVIGGLFTYRLLSSFMSAVFSPLIDIFLPTRVTENMNISLTGDFQRVYINRISTTIGKNIEYVFALGDLLREFIIWVFVMTLLFIFYKISN